ncbi:MAG: hypothetical protein ACK4NC_00025 [Candidatus Gracilibacteria bacterium]
MQDISSTSTLSERTLGPRAITNYHVITKTVAGLFGGIAGTIVMVITLLLASNLFKNGGAQVATELSQNASAITRNEINIFILMAGAFLSSLSGNIMAFLGFSLFDHEKYTKVVSTIVQIMIVNLLVFVFIMPAYLVISSAKLSNVSFLVGAHIMLATLLCIFVSEVINNIRHVLVGFYGAMFGILMGIGAELLMALLPKSNDQLIAILVLTMLPVTLATMGFFSSIFEMFYGWLYRLYGIDWLGTIVSDDELETSLVEEGETINEE